METNLQIEIDKLSTKINEKLDKVQTEEATKTAFILPFIRLVLCYDHTDPEEVVPEYVADVGIKKGEKVDYAIIIDNKPVILMECKPAYCDLDKEHASQLYRYFSVTEAKFGILTNGIVYQFFTDIEEPNKMDTKPFFEIDLKNVKESDLAELNQFTKSSFDMDNILESASELKYKGEIKKIIAKELKEPSDGFVRFFAKQVYSRILTKNAMENFTEITKAAFRQFINEKVEERIKTALASEGKDEEPEKIHIKPKKDEIITTEEEWEGYYIVKSILSEIVDPARVTIRDRLSYCNVLLDDNQYKTICRMHFNGKQKYVGFFDKQEKTKTGAKIEDKITIETPNEIYKHALRLKNTANIYLKK
ncbi:MAG: type I restriction enzyme HsdR N-terminal domain-containing protein [Methanobacterium sp.]|nr:type I restriction enzyme HsdR N-terminal domain-containing protein [Methanobacterium sp.]